jgi:hypothetical protein
LDLYAKYFVSFHESINIGNDEFYDSMKVSLQNSAIYNVSNNIHPNEVIGFQPYYVPGVYSASNRNEYQESSQGGKGQPAYKADNLTAICEPIV